MDKTTNLIEIKEDSVWSKIKKFFKKVFYFKKENTEIGNNQVILEQKKDNKQTINIPLNTGFIQNNKELLELQSKYHRGEIKESDLTSEQIRAISDLYDKQIKELRASNEVRKQRLLKYRNKMMTTADTKVSTTFCI
jgi:hypothetical protein